MTFKVTYDPLYSDRSDGKIQVWYAEQEEDQYRIVTGLWDGKGGITASSEVISAWKQASPTNVGRSNERDGIDQAIFEINALYTKREEQGAVWNVGDAPMFEDKIEPMLAAKYDASKVKFPVWSQPKLDGGRCLVVGSSTMMSRNWKPIISAPHIARDLEHLTLEGFQFDGELYNHDFRDNFEKIMSLVRKSKPEPQDLEESERLVQYWIYDIIIDDLDFAERYALIEDMDLPSSCIKVPTTKCNSHEEIDALYGEYLAAGFEGQMIRTNTHYEYKRTKALQKRKEFEDNEFEIVGFEDALGNWKDCVKAVVCYDKENDVQFKATLDGDRERSRAMWLERDQYIGGTVTVRHQARTKKNFVPRFGVVKYIYKGQRDI